MPDEVTRLAFSYAIGRTCFECRLIIAPGELVTLIWLGILPIYIHTAHVFPEEKVQAIREATIEGEIYSEQTRF